MVRLIRVLLCGPLALGLWPTTVGSQVQAPAKPLAKPTAAKRPVSPEKPPPPAASAAMLNADVIKLVQAGIGESVVITAVRTAAKTSFQVNTDELIALKKAGVSDSIVAAMLDPKAAVTASPPPAAALVVGSGNMDTRARVTDPHAAVEIPRDPGIYVDLGTDTPNLVAMEPTVFSQGKSGGMLTSALTYGIKKAKWKAVVRAPGASLRLPDATPVFYFYFEQRSSGLGGSGGFAGWLAGATSPNEFVLAKMTVKPKERELIVGEFGLTGASTGTRSKDTVEFDVQKLGGGAYKVTPLEPLLAGEYSFFYAAGASALGAGGTGKLFDFGVSSAPARK